MSITCIFINELQVHSLSAAKDDPFHEEKNRDNNQWELKIDFEEDLWLFKGESWRSKKTFMMTFKVIAYKIIANRFFEVDLWEYNVKRLH